MSKDFQIRKKYVNSNLRSGNQLRNSSLTPIQSSPERKSEGSSALDHEKIFWKKYQLEKEIGKGGYGVVLLVKDRLTGQQLAVKILEKEGMSEEVYSRLKNEPHHLGKLAKSTNIVQIYDSFETKRRLFILMEYLRGGDLLQFIQQRKSLNSYLNESEVSLVVIGLFKALKAIHNNNIIHGDIKPGKFY